jgi:hypothetical protein
MAKDKAESGSQQYTLPDRGFYRLGHYYKPGEPFTIADGTRPQRDALKYPSGEPAWESAEHEKAARMEAKSKAAPPMYATPEVMAERKQAHQPK